MGFLQISIHKKTRNNTKYRYRFNNYIKKVPSDNYKNRLCQDLIIMDEDGLPKYGEENKLPPIELTPQQEGLCRRLDALNQMTIQGQELSNIFRGAIFATRKENRSNPDWIAQSAHSLREIIYLYKSNKTKGKKYRGNWINAFRTYGSVVTVKKEIFEQIINEVYRKITGVAHHQPINIDEYYKLIDQYQSVLLWALTRQDDVHNQIDEFFSVNKPGQNDE